MNRIPYMLVVLFVFVMHGVSVYAAPVGNIGDPILWNPSPFKKEAGLPLFATLTCERQINHLPEQITRFPWTNPSSTPPEERHYPQTRWSRNSIDTLGVKIGLPIFDKAVVYSVMGYSTATIDFNYKDWTVSRNFYSLDTFESGPEVFYGCGADFIMHRGEYDRIPFTVGMDVSYRRYHVEEDRLNSDGVSYSANLNEIQLAFSVSSEFENFSPYCGVKVASITGDESYINMNYSTNYYIEGYIHYNQDIVWSKNLGYFLGVTTAIKGLVTVGLEIRGYDENSIGLNATTSF